MGATPQPMTCRITRHAKGRIVPRLTLEVEADYAQPFIEGMYRLPSSDRYRSTGGRWWVAPAHLATLIMLALDFDHAWLVEGDKTTDLKTGQRA